MDLRSSRGSLQVCRRGTLDACWSCTNVEEAQRYGALEMRCRRCLKRGMELRSSSVLLLLEFLAFVPRGSLGKTLALCLTPENAAHNCGHPANLSGVTLISTRSYSFFRSTNFSTGNPS